MRIAGPHLQSFWLSRLGVEPQDIISNMLPGDPDTAGPGPHLEDYLD